MTKFLTGLSWQSIALLIGAVFFFGFAAGWQTSGWKFEASQGRSIAKQEKTRVIIQDKSDLIVKDDIKATAAIQTHHQKIEDTIHEKNDNRICFADNAALQLWNSAITGADTYSAQPDATATGTDTAQNQAIIATVEEVLLNANQNFEISRKNSQHHKSCIAFLEEINGKACACAE